MSDRDKIIQFRFTGYLIKSVQNHRKRYIEKRDIRKSIEVLYEDFDEIASDNTYDEDSWAFSNLIEFSNPDIHMAFLKLKTRDIQIIILHILEKYSIKEIADLYGMNYDAIYKRFKRAIEILKNSTGDESEF